MINKLTNEFKNKLLTEAGLIEKINEIVEVSIRFKIPDKNNMPNPVTKVIHHLC
tara:strand:+ start:188 stop:349 length:162 start_codon:yes stop_codon:yes gene_type:complete